MYELRVACVDNNVFAAKIDSQASEKTIQTGSGCGLKNLQVCQSHYRLQMKQANYFHIDGACDMLRLFLYFIAYEQRNY